MRQQGLVHIQMKYFQEVLKLFNITDYDIFGATSDAGPDIKNMMKEQLRCKSATNLITSEKEGDQVA